MNRKPVIICIVGESASGKSSVANFMSKRYGIDIIHSYTTRPMRPAEIEKLEAGEELDHKFISNEEYDKILPEDMIAHTQFGEYRYCCVKQDIKPFNLYIIDEDGLDYLERNFSDDYIIYSVRIWCNPDERIRRAIAENPKTGEERAGRDIGRFKKPLAMFNSCVCTDVPGEIIQFHVDVAISDMYKHIGTVPPVVNIEPYKY